MKNVISEGGVGCLVAVILFVLALAVSWAATVGIIYLICLCFHWQFTLLVATGVWLVMCLLSGTFKVVVNNKK